MNDQKDNATEQPAGFAEVPILVVEDNPSSMRLARSILSSSGFEVLEAGSGEEALKAVRETPPDLILMDMRLPGISGLEATQLIKAHDNLRDVPIVAVTASALKGDKEKILAGGCDGFIAKPISIPNFLATIAQFLGESS